MTRKFVILGLIGIALLAAAPVGAARSKPVMTPTTDQPRPENPPPPPTYVPVSPPQ